MVSCESAGKPVQPTKRSGNCTRGSVVSRVRGAGLAGVTHVGEDLDGVLNGAETVSLEGVHVEDIDALDLAEELEALDTGGLLLAGNGVSMLLPGCVLAGCWLDDEWQLAARCRVCRRGPEATMIAYCSRARRRGASERVIGHSDDYGLLALHRRRGRQTPSHTPTWACMVVRTHAGAATKPHGSDGGARFQRFPSRERRAQPHSRSTNTKAQPSTLRSLLHAQSQRGPRTR